MDLLRPKAVGILAGASIAVGVAAAAVWHWRNRRRGGGTRRRIDLSAVSELSEFEAAAEHARSLKKLSRSMQMALYKYYKQGSEGPCNIPAPSQLDMFGRQKWEIWSSLGDMPQQEAQARYVAVVDKISPEWRKQFDKVRLIPASDEKGAIDDMEDFSEQDLAEESKAAIISPAVSTMMPPQEDPNDSKNDLAWFAALEDEKDAVDGINQLMKEGADVNQKFDGETALHFAADRGHVGVIQALLDHGAEVDATEDEEGLTPLAYACFAEHEAAAKYLISRGARLDKELADGSTVREAVEDCVPAILESL